MTKPKQTATHPALAATEPMMEWWQKHLSQGATPMARMQLAWMQSMADALQFEAEFLKTLAESGQRLAKSFDGATPQTPAEMNERYQAIMSEISEAQMERMQKAAELSLEFRRNVWEEI
ncbi:hypothetical protein [Halomonas aquatica]|uniref:Phasin domain-containing protein n=1 Tax=Halomonas aquatica TaxID=3151123 RepID=A0ABV1NFL3_9GAMM